MGTENTNIQVTGALSLTGLYHPLPVIPADPETKDMISLLSFGQAFCSTTT